MKSGEEDTIRCVGSGCFFIGNKTRDESMRLTPGRDLVMVLGVKVC